jgi:hypothetical protein
MKSKVITRLEAHDVNIVFRPGKDSWVPILPRGVNGNPAIDVHTTTNMFLLFARMARTTEISPVLSSGLLNSIP